MIETRGGIVIEPKVTWVSMTINWPAEDAPGIGGDVKARVGSVKDGGPNIFEKIWGCPEPIGELACKCSPDPLCFGLHATNWKHLGPECNRTERASESSNPELAKLDRFDQRMFRGSINVPRQLAGDEFTEITADGIIATGFYRLGLYDDEPADRPLAKYDELDNNRDYVEEILAKGGQKARAVACDVMDEVRKATGIRISRVR